MTEERRHGVDELIERLIRLEEKFTSHAQSEDADRQHIMQHLRETSTEVRCIKERVNKMSGFAAGVASAMSLLIGALIWALNKVFGS